MRHVISAIVRNTPGVLSRVSGLFSSRGFNIDSLVVAETEADGLSRMTIVALGDDAILEQIRKQLSKVIDVVKVHDFSGIDYVERDLLLIKINAPPARRNEIFQLVEVFRGKIVDISRGDVMIELSGPEAKTKAFAELVRPFGIKELARTGRVAMARGPKMGGEKKDPSAPKR